MPISQIVTNSIANGAIIAADIASGQTLSLNGITFPATQVPSADANTLDDYEEGTWTPSLIGGFSSAPTSYPSQSGSYVKVGRLVYFQLDMDANGATGNATPVQIGGLPFTSGGPEGFGGASRSYQIQFDQNALTSYHISNGQNFIILYDVNGNAVTGTAGGININNRIILFGCYRSAA
jgi:hypothetical protein